MNAQRCSEYDRIHGDTYVTPLWVYRALYDVEPWAVTAWDCAPENAEFDFLQNKGTTAWGHIATNPPFSLADKFVRTALAITKEAKAKVAMLLPMTWDCAKSRLDLFENPPFKAKYTITKRIRWENLEQKKNGPSTNHAWFVWDWTYEGKPFLGYLP